MTEREMEVLYLPYETARLHVGIRVDSDSVRWARGGRYLHLQPTLPKSLSRQIRCTRARYWRVSESRPLARRAILYSERWLRVRSHLLIHIFLSSWILPGVLVLLG